MEIETRTLFLNQAISEARLKSGRTPEDSENQVRTNRRLDETQPIDWKEMAARISAMQGNQGPRGIREMVALQKRLLKMTNEELAAALDEIAILDISVVDRTRLESNLLEIYAEKAPAEALERFADRLSQDDGIFWQLRNAFRNWAGQDPRTAAAWMDKQIAAGKFDSRTLDGQNELRINFEAVLLGKMLGTDPDGTTSRLNALTSEQRLQVLSRSEFKDSDSATYANLLRGATQGEESLRNAFSQTGAKLLNEGGFEKVDGFLRDAGLSAMERDAVIREAAATKVNQSVWQNGFNKEKVDEAREWLGRQAPEIEAHTTGSILARAGDQGQFDKAAEIALQYHESSGSDELLATFIENAAAQGANKDRARQLIDHLSDPVRKAALIGKLK